MRYDDEVRWLCPILLLLGGCSTLSGARPLAPGEHAVGATIGGAMIELGGPLPLPNVVLEGRSGVATLANRNLDVNYGLNATGLPFGLLAGHVGASWMLLDQNGAAPALSLGNRVWFGVNAFNIAYRDEPRLQAYAVDQVEVDASWLLGQHLLYVGVAQYFDVKSPSFTLTPALGTELDFAEPGGFVFHTELRWFAVGQKKILDTVNFVPNNVGALGITLGGSYRF